MSQNPKLILLFSGKRKSGKDYLAAKLQRQFGTSVGVLVTLSAPLKAEYAKIHGLQFDRLMDTSTYKERHRQAMIVWGEEIRYKDPGYFCEAAINLTNAKGFPLWIISDARRSSDIKYFQDNYGPQLRTVRINATEATRKQRGWVFAAGIDDGISECGLDEVQDWDYVIDNDSDYDAEPILKQICETVEDKVTVTHANDEDKE